MAFELIGSCDEPFGRWFRDYVPAKVQETADPAVLL